MEGVIAAPDRDKLGERTKYTSRDPKRLFSGLRTQRLKTKKKTRSRVNMRRWDIKF